jgi:hypothetical protein
MANYLIRKQWGYQTCCPDEENTVGYYTFKDHKSVEVYTRPSYESDTYDKVLDKQYERWKYNHSKALNLTLKEMDDKFGNIYTIEDSGIRIGLSIGLWGWEKVNNKEEETTWIRVHEDENLWIPFENYEYDSSDEEEDVQCVIQDIIEEG